MRNAKCGMRNAEGGSWGSGRSGRAVRRHARCKPRETAWEEGSVYVYVWYIPGRCYVYHPPGDVGTKLLE